MSYFCGVGIAAVAYVDVHPDWFFTPGGSAPQGIWRIVDPVVNDPYPRGSWIVVCPPLNAEAHQQLFNADPPVDEACASKPSLKQIAAIPGDRVIVAHPVVITPLRAVEAVPIDPTGHPLPQPADGEYVVADDTYWVLSGHPRSVDSRYYGAVSKANIERRVRPIWTVQ